MNKFLIVIIAILCYSHLKLYSQDDLRNIDLVIKLETQLFPDNNDVNDEQVNLILEEIYETKDVTLIEPLKSLIVKINKLKDSANRFETKYHSVIPLRYNIGVVVLGLSLFEKELFSADEKFEYIRSELMRKFNNVPVDVTVEAAFLRDNATEYNSHLVGLLREGVNDRLKKTAINVLKNSKSPTLEKDILGVINDYKDNLPIYRRLIFLLGYIGNSESFYFIKNIYESTNNEEIKKSTISAFKVFRNRTNIEKEIVDRSKAIVNENTEPINYTPILQNNNHSGLSPLNNNINPNQQPAVEYKSNPYSGFNENELVALLETVNINDSLMFLWR